MSQPRNRGSNYLQSLGPNDPDRKTPGHDWILLDWLTKPQLLELGTQWFPIHDWTSDRVAQVREYANNQVTRELADAETQLSKDRARLDKWPGGKDASDSSPVAKDLQAGIPNVERRIERLRSWKGLDEPPPPQLTVVAIQDAHPIYDGERSRRPAIYIDRFVRFERGAELALSADAPLPAWRVVIDHHSVAFEIKSRIPSYSELIQQLTTYRGFLGGKVKIVVVCPDEKFKSAIEEQGFAFIKCPEPPKSSRAQEQLFE